MTMTLAAGSKGKNMNDKKDQHVAFFQGIMLILNCLAVVLLCAFIYITTERIRRDYHARSFLDGVKAIPEDPGSNLRICLFMMGILALNFVLRQFWKEQRHRWVIATLVLDFLVCIRVIWQLDFNYNGLLLLVFANVISYVKDGKTKLLFVSLAVVGYLVADHNLLSIYRNLYAVTDYIHYYSSGIQQYLFSIYDIVISLNIILFIVYCVYVINAQKSTIDEVNRLYKELQSANEQLKEYADMSERMAQTRERNRLAREIHDTLGHTLTGISAGLDACLALVDVSPDETKKQLELLAGVSREGIRDVRRSVNELRPDALERLSLEVAVRKMIVDMSRVSDVQIYFDTEEKHLKFDEDEENAVYRVIQEGITNAVRHGRASRIWISLKRIEGEIVLSIRDDGIGCKEIKSGFGTRHIRERIEMLHGTVNFDGRHGFVITAHIPIRWGENYD